jgi:hypothetical protein
MSDNEFTNIFGVVSGIATIVLALWGSVLSTIMFFQDRSRIKVGFDNSFLIHDSVVPVFSFTVINYGRRPITINSFIIKTSNSSPYPIIMPNEYIKYELPQKLNENEICSIVIEKSNFQRIKDCKIKKVYFTDILGKKYILKKRFYKYLLI